MGHKLTGRIERIITGVKEVRVSDEKENKNVRVMVKITRMVMKLTTILRSKPKTLLTVTVRGCFKHCFCSFER